ncbi:conserved membrane hypothetical protein [Hyphomicrobiales bacterium]|jgi:hypothetical protein|nr:conserved membrane hypothetical protein [Hyphomicrobiales bacterium]CAH1702403.1 Putative membrane protein [Hyphomicrobiales bacterium]CAI0346603.1 conserved membrane hypothetical protein [Hyphomicrobiales bacterium]
MKNVIAALAAMVLGLGSMAAEAAQGSCSGIQLQKLVSNASFLSDKMVRVASPSPDAIAFVHPDDSRLSVAFALQSVPAEAISRADFVKDLERRLDREVAARTKPGLELQRGIFPYDPVSWTLSSRQQSNDGVRVQGNMTVRLTAGCHLLASWEVIEIPVLMSRIAGITSALDAVRLRAPTVVAASEFLPDRRVPQGMQALVYGLLGPTAAALALVFGLSGWLNRGRPSVISRVSLAAGALVGLYGLMVEAPVLKPALQDLRYLDHVLLAVAAILAMTVGAILGSQRSVLIASTFAICAGLSIAVSAALGWAPIDTVAPTLALAYIGAGVAGFGTWSIRHIGMPKARAR